MLCGGYVQETDRLRVGGSRYVDANTRNRFVSLAILGFAPVTYSMYNVPSLEAE